MKCPECYSENRGLAKFCIHCGAYLKADENPKKWTAFISLLLALFTTSFFYQIFPIPLISLSYWGVILTSHWICKLIVFSSLWCFYILIFYYLHYLKNRKLFYVVNSSQEVIFHSDIQDIRKIFLQKGFKKYYHHILYRFAMRLKNQRLDKGDIKTFFESENYKIDLDYTLVRFFIWAIPILGFIGTVAGIAFSVSEFSSFIQNLKGMEELSQEMKSALSGVTSGLSAAFNTTFLALILILPLMFFSNVLQKKEEELLLTIEENFLHSNGENRKKKKKIRFIL